MFSTNLAYVSGDSTAESVVAWRVRKIQIGNKMNEERPIPNQTGQTLLLAIFSPVMESAK